MSNGSSNQVFTDTQKRITHPENGRKKIVDRTKSTEYENEQLCDSGGTHRDTNVLIEKQETKQIRVYTDNRETKEMSTSNDTRQKMSAEKYSKSWQHTRKRLRTQDSRFLIPPNTYST